jgi:hypothetical protein
LLRTAVKKQLFIEPFIDPVELWLFPSSIPLFDLVSLYLAVLQVEPNFIVLGTILPTIMTSVGHTGLEANYLPIHCYIVAAIT